mgnify:CR=1 FL=1
MAAYVALFALVGYDFNQYWGILIAPLYPIYFWALLLSSFLAGFPKGFLRLDSGNWKRTVRRIEAGAPA